MTSTAISFIMIAYSRLTVCTLISEPSASCKMECDLTTESNFHFNCSATIPAFSDKKCTELYPNTDICNTLTDVSTTPGVSIQVANGRLANVTVCANSKSMFLAGTIV